MSLKHRNLIALLLFFVASVAWVYGMGIANRKYDSIIVESTVFTNVQTTGVTEMTVESTVIHQIVEHTEVSIDPTTESVIPTTSVEVDEYPTLPTVDPPRNIPQIYGFILVFFALGCAGIGFFVFYPKAPFCGLDGICLLLSVLSLIGHYGIVSTGSDLYYILMLFLFIVGVWELCGWWKKKFLLSYCTVYRVASACRLPQRSLLFYVVWLIFSFGCMVLCLAVNPHNFTTCCVHSVNNIPVLYLGLRCLWRYGKDLSHFQTQLDNYQNGLPICVGEGAFAQTESQLLKVQAQHEEAVRTAITGERFKVELISNVSHDLRTPLTSILGYSELLQKETLSSEGKEQLRRLHQKAGYMNDLVDSLFELTKVSSGVVESKKEQIDLVRLLEQTIGLFDDQLVSAGLMVKRSYYAEVIPIITDGARMHQVFSNLLGNAIKYALAGTRIYLEVKETDNSYFVRMMNTASYEMDFKPDEIIERFARGDKARSTKGSGLGLAIAQTYTESVGGSFRVSVDGDQFSAIVGLPKTERNL